MKILFQAISILILMIWPASRAAAEERVHTLRTTTAEVKFQSGKLAVGATFSVAVKGHNDRRLEAGIDRAMRRLEGRIGMELRRGPATDSPSPTLGPTLGPTLVPTLVIECREAGESVPSLDQDESYSLEVSDGRAAL